MPKRRSGSEPEQTRRRPATTPEARESQMVSLAHDLAEKQIRKGTASSQVITHFLKLGSSREVLEQQRLQYEAELARVKIEAVHQQARMEELYSNAIAAMRSYSPDLGPVEPDVED